MRPELKKNRVFSEWLEEWTAKAQNHFLGRRPRPASLSKNCPVCDTRLSKSGSQPLLSSGSARRDTYLCEMGHMFIPRTSATGIALETSLFGSGLKAILRLLGEIIWPYELRPNSPVPLIHFPRRDTTAAEIGSKAAPETVESPKGAESPPIGRRAG